MQVLELSQVEQVSGAGIWSSLGTSLAHSAAWETFSSGVSFVWSGITNPSAYSPNFTSYDPMGNYTGF